MPRTGAYVSGINKLYTIASIEGQYIKLKEVEMTPIGYRLEAGMPYIYEKKTNANSISICYLNEEVETPLIDHAFLVLSRIFMLQREAMSFRVMVSFI